MIALGGFAAACLVTPGLAYAAKLFPDPTGRDNVRLRRTINSLIRQGYVTSINDQYRLTAKGVLYFNRIKIQEFTLPIYDKKQWNGKWYIVIFDIPESHKDARDSFRRRLLDFSFKQVQQSVYVHMFDYAKELHALADLHDVEIDILTMEISRIDGEKQLKKDFGL